MVSRRLLLVGTIACLLPDLDVLAFQFHIAYSHVLGHRGFTHSLGFALALALLLAAFAPYLRSARSAAFMFVGVSTISHGLLDMLTNGGLGIALWWPWSDKRLFFPSQIIEVSPLSLSRVFSARGLAVIQSEILWIWLPASLSGIALFALRRTITRRPPTR